MSSPAGRIVAAVCSGVMLMTVGVCGEDLDLSGPWRFRLDPDDRGESERWFDTELPDDVRLPGSLQEQGFGDVPTVETEWTGQIVDSSWYTEEKYAAYREPGNVKIPFWLQPERHYVGKAWYQRTVEIPRTWDGKHIALHLERPHWQTDVWIDGQHAGSNDSLSTPHVYNLSEALTPGAHTLSIRVDNRMIVDVGINAHSVSDHTQSNWNGLAGRLALVSHEPLWIDDIQVYSDHALRSAEVRLSITNQSGLAGVGNIRWQVMRKDAATSGDSMAAGEFPVFWDPHGAETGWTIELGPDARAWDEFSPELYTVRVTLEPGSQSAVPPSSREVSFGLRELAVAGTQFTVNGRKTFLRGTLECCIFPLTGYPPTDLESWKRIIRICRDHGLNHIRFHSWCPPEAAFDAADELGFYLQPEVAMWGSPTKIHDWLYAETQRILDAYGNHPSFVLMASGNEPRGEQVQSLGNWLDHFKAEDSRRLYTGSSGWPLIEQSDYHVWHQEIRIQAWGAELNSLINAEPPQTEFDWRGHVEAHPEKPTVSHEIGQWCAYPNFEEMKKYTGVLKPKNFEIFLDRLKANHMGDQAGDFLMASGKLQTLCYKADIEAALRTKGFGGFQLLDLHDFPGQGTALVGILDPFWDSKPYVNAETFRRFCNSTVPLARMRKRTWTAAETFEAEIEIAHFGPVPIEGAEPVWEVVNGENRTVITGTLPVLNIPIDNGTALGRVVVPCADLAPARRYRLNVGVKGTEFENSWNFWVYPTELETATPNGVYVSDRLDDIALERLAAGGRVLLTLDPDRIATTAVVGFSSVFWNTAWTRNQAPHTLGILCDPAHRVFSAFPTEYHTNWQWWELIHGAAAMVLDGMPPALRPLVQPIDTWFEARRLGLLFEAQLNGGKLMVCSMDLDSRLEERVVARQFRHSLLSYMQSDAFDPQVEVTETQLRQLLLRGAK